MIHDTLSTGAARRFYDFWGAGYDWFSFTEARAKARALELLDLAPGQYVLNAGLGTGKEHLQIQAAIAPDGKAYGVDLSSKMVSVARARTGASLCQADARSLPFTGATFDRLYCAYVLDLIAAVDLPALLSRFRRILKPGGRMILVCLTEGVDLPSRAFVSLWKAAYGLSPAACGGCRPLRLSGLAQHAGFIHIQSEVVVQLGVPSEILMAMG